MRRVFRKRLYFLNISRMRKDKKLSIGLFFLILTLIICLCGYYYITTMQPLLEEYVQAELRNRMNLTVNRVAEREISQSGITYTSLISMEKDKDGRIMSLSTDVAAMNKLKLAIETSIVEEILASREIEVKVPFGSLLGSEFFSGRGPNIHIRVLPMAQVYSKYDNRFESAGINQTRHQIFLEYNISLKMLLPGKRAGTEVTSSVCVTETIVVGLVPQLFAGDQN